MLPGIADPQARREGGGRDHQAQRLPALAAPPRRPTDPEPDGADPGSEPAPAHSAIELANERIFEAGHTGDGAPAQGAMGTTVVVLDCVLDDGRTYWAYVGDSRLYRVRDGDLALLTADHTLLGEAFWNQAKIPSDLPHTNRLMRALGITPTVEVSVGSDATQPGDLFLLCSDGVSGMIKPSDFLDELGRDQPLDQAGSALIQKALDAGGKDNASLLLVRVTEG